jgi:PBP1b-binding outer membrane lipoprotein LpoB
MKKSLVFALIAVFALSIFAVGCKKEEAAPETTTEAAPATTESTPAVDTAAAPATK